MKRKSKVRTSFNFQFLRDRAFNAQHGKCFFCGRALALHHGPHSEMQATGCHLEPRWAGGKTEPGNVVAVCRDCNQKHEDECLGSYARNDPHDPVNMSAGDDSARSPFEKLSALKTR